ncbi:MAG: phosphate acyltransferase PlsX [Ruminococcaceae bacterium]|nr:phosphate acyltransferase PlsX [Oscillospiraceae bacterium]
MKITVAVDIMGGDNPPSELAQGAVNAAKEFAGEGLELILVCTEDAASQLPQLPKNVTLELANSVVEMTDDPSVVMKEKKDSSLVTAVTLCKEGRADAVVSAGNTGALFTASSLIIRRIKGVRRAALGSIIPVEKPFILLDCGANLDATPEILQLYARMGSIYAQVVLGIENPRVGLLNNGTEPHKGIALYQETYKLLSADETINFVGNCEGKSLPFDACDVLVCDGFTGNIALKIIEGMAKFMGHCIKGIFHAGPLAMLGGALTLKQTKALKEQVDPSEYGGAPFLGLAKPVVKAHGSSDAYSFRSAIKQVLKYCKGGTIEKITASMANKNSSVNIEE